MKAPLPPNEAQRLETLRGYDVLDTPPESVFDDLTLLAAQICHVPIALISLVDENRQWFKSAIGVSTTETSRDVAFCAHTILNPDELFEVRDTQLDSRFADNPLVIADPHIRFYAASPLVAPDGLALGTLCVIDRVPRELSVEQQTALRTLSRTVIAQLELRRILAECSRVKEQLQSLNASLEQQVEARTADLSATLQAIPDLLFELDQNGKYINIWANNPELLVAQKETLLGHTVREMFPTEAANTVLSALREAGEKGYSHSQIIRLDLPHGEFWFELSTSVKATADDSAKSFIMLSRDITNRKQAEMSLRERESQLKAIVENLTEGLAVSDLDGQLLHFNRAALDLHGFTTLDECRRCLPEFADTFELSALDGTVLSLDQWPLARILRNEKLRDLELYVRHIQAGWQRIFSYGGSIARDADDQPLLAIVTINDITEHKRTEEALRETDARTKLILDMAMDAVISINQEGMVIGWNREAERMFGYAADHAMGKDLSELIVPPAYRKAHKQGMQHFVKSGSSTIIGKRIEINGMCADGSEIPVELAIIAVLRQGSYFFNAFVRDITERKLSESNLRIAATAFESHESLMITDASRVILRVNQAFIEETGYTAEEIIGKTPRLLSSGRHKSDFYRAMWEAINRTGTWQGEIWDRRKNGEIYPKWLTITAVKGEGGVVTHYVGAHIDITERKAAEEEIQYLAFYDPLTRLPNRRLLMDRLQQALASSARIGREGALLLIDLDNFQTLNDTLGHLIGDLLLQQVAQRLESCVRDGDTVARLGGDEFVVMLKNLSEHALEAAAQTEAISEKILAILAKTYQLDTYEHHCTASIGVTLFNGNSLSTDELMKQADIAMYQAKKTGRNTLRFFDPQMQAGITARVSLEGELRKALERQQFHLYYQIQVDSSSRPLGAESLIRWIHPERGMVSPAQFIPLAEETGLILPIGLWVLETACAQLKAWQKAALTRDFVLAVNVSAKQFHQADFVAQVHDAVQRHAINPMRLKLELTEGMLLENIEDTIATMHALKEFGVQFSLDDFGTGYSSLQYLKRLPLNQLKIDQSFVRDIATDSSDKAIVRTIIAMAQGLDMDVIAEGVETEENRQFLLDNGCTHYQGYLFGKPVPIGLFEELLKQD